GVKLGAGPKSSGSGGAQQGMPTNEGANGGLLLLLGGGLFRLFHRHGSRALIRWSLRALRGGLRGSRRGRDGVGGSRLRFVLGALLLDLAPVGDRRVVLLQRIGEHVSAGAVGDEVEVVGGSRIKRRLDRRPPRVADRRRRLTVDLVGVVA